MPDHAPIGEEVDVLIVGSGPAGSTYARTIADAAPDATVLMVEVGPRLGDPIGEHTMNLDEAARVRAQQLAQGPAADVERGPLTFSLSASATQSFTVARAADDPATDAPFVFPGLFLLGEGSRADGEFGLPVAAMSSGVGGMGVFWGGSCPRPNGTERVPFIDAAELDAALDRAEVLLQVSKDLHGDDELLERLRALAADEFEPDAPGCPEVGFMPVAMQRAGTGARTSGPGQILGSLAAGRVGFELRAETLVRRVLLDGDMAVGAELVDRRSGTVTAVRARRVVVCADSLRTPQLLFASGIRPAALGHHLNDHLQMSSFAMLHDDLAAIPPTTGAPPAMGSVLIPFAGPERPMQGQIVPIGRTGYRFPFADALDGLDASGLAIMAWYGAKDIQFSDAVEFSDDETDSYGMPRMRIRYRLTDTDRRTVEQLRANAERSAKLVGQLLAPPSFAPGGSSLHYQGTVRMGAADDGTSVCDALCRVWGVRHLHVGGNGVIPTATAANPTLTNVALAHRAASALAADL